MPTEQPIIRFDWAIKTLLREKANFDVLEGFLSALLGEPITIEQILESESNAGEKQKYNRVDILVHDSQGRRLIIEVQNDRESDYLERLLFGASKTIAENLALGDAYGQVVKVISISILYFNLGAGDDYVYYGATEFRGIHTGHSLEVRKRVVLPEGGIAFRARNVFPEYYLINVERFEDVIRNDLDEWIYLLKHAAVRDDFRSPNMDRAREKLALMKMSPKARRAYERYVESLVIERDVIDTARREGHKEGQKKGKKEGREEERKAIARSLRERGMNIQEIAAITELPEEEIDLL